MSFRVWFKRWVNSFLRLLRVGSSPYKSSAQRERARERRRKAKHSHRRGSSSSGRRKPAGSLAKDTLDAIFGFVGATLRLIPALLRSLVSRDRRSGGGRGARRATGKATPRPVKLFTKSRKTSANNEASVASSGSHPKQPKEKKPKETQQKKKASPPPAPEPKQKEQEEEVQTTIPDEPPVKTEEPVQEEAQQAKEKVLDENAPKSVPKNAADQYIRKRMMIAGSSYCDQAVLDRIEIGTQLEIVAEPDNPYDSDAIMLLLDGEKVGYIAKQDQLAYVTCLRLKRSVYAVVTDISDDSPPKYEYETWFASK